MTIEANNDRTDAHCCETMRQSLAESEVAIVYIPKFREYGIPILDGGSSFQLIAYCPWCGCKLPESLRDEWIEAIERLGMEPGDDDVPEEYLSNLWWSCRNDLQR